MEALRSRANRYQPYHAYRRILTFEITVGISCPICTKEGVSAVEVIMTVHARVGKFDITAQGLVACTALGVYGGLTRDVLREAI